MAKTNRSSHDLPHAHPDEWLELEFPPPRARSNTVGGTGYCVVGSENHTPFGGSSDTSGGCASHPTHGGSRSISGSGTSHTVGGNWHAFGGSSLTHSGGGVTSGGGASNPVAAGPAAASSLSSARCQSVFPPTSSVNPRPHKRTASLKKPRKKTPLDLGGGLGGWGWGSGSTNTAMTMMMTMEGEELDDEMRPRTSSLPTKNSLRRPKLRYLTPPYTSHHSSTRCGVGYGGEHSQDEVYTIRSFVTTSKGQLVNRGDSLRSRSTNSIMSSGSAGSITELTHLSRASSQGSLCQEGDASGSGSLSALSLSLLSSSSPQRPPGAPSLEVGPFRVLMLGSPGVGKSSLTEQFSTSEYLGTFGPSIDSYREKSVSLLIDGEESTVIFIDPEVEGDAPDELVNGFVLVFRIDDRGTFAHATDLLYDLRKARGLQSALILVANKCDLVRSREVSTEEAKSVAATYDCKYVETSVVLNHNVDELLVGIVTQMRLLSEDKKGGGSKRSKHGASTDDSGCYAKSRHLLNKILFRKYPISKSCENLYVL